MHPPSKSTLDEGFPGSVGLSCPLCHLASQKVQLLGTLAGGLALSWAHVEALAGGQPMYMTEAAGRSALCMIHVGGGQALLNRRDIILWLGPAKGVRLSAYRWA